MRRFLILIAIASGLLACADGSDQGSPPREQHVLSQTVEPVTPVISNLGAPCTANDECKGTGTRCITTSQISGLTYPGGFCTASCTKDEECGENGWCPLATMDAGIFPSPEVRAAVTVCLVKCEADSDCREGYICSLESTLTFLPPSNNMQKYCRPPPKPPVAM